MAPRCSANDERRVTPLRAPDHVGLSSFDSGGFPGREAPAAGRAAQQVSDVTRPRFRCARLRSELVARRKCDARLRRWRRSPTRSSSTASAQATLTTLAARREETLAGWRERLGRVSIRVPAQGQRVVDSLRSALGHILVSRSGPVLRPGTRSYARSWIRDGAMMAESLLRLGHEQEARAYLEWFAPFQFENGKVPCCVDRRGADPVVENDSAGEFLFLIAQLYRFTRERPLLERMWPHVEAAVRYMDELRLSRAHAQEPGASTARVLRAHAAFHQPRRLLGQACLLLLGRLLGADRLPGGRLHRGGDGSRRGAGHGSATRATSSGRM